MTEQTTATITDRMAADAIKRYSREQCAQMIAKLLGLVASKRSLGIDCIEMGFEGSKVRLTLAEIESIAATIRDHHKLPGYRQ